MSHKCIVAGIEIQNLVYLHMYVGKKLILSESTDLNEAEHVRLNDSIIVFWRFVSSQFVRISYKNIDFSRVSYLLSTLINSELIRSYFSRGCAAETNLDVVPKMPLKNGSVPSV